MIKSRLFEWYNIDTQKNLGIKKICPKPFDTILIDRNGSCFACDCQAWLPQSIGNLQIQDLSEILNNKTHRELQDSITDGSYRYCNENQCSWILSNTFDNDKKIESRVKFLRLAIDNSCNLHCPSCRNKKIFIKSGAKLKMMMKLADKILKYLEQQKHKLTVHIGSDGDPFASLVYRYFMRSVPDTDLFKYSILTNGLLLKKQFPKMQTVFNNMQVLNISIDGADKKVYDQLRRGGDYDQLIENFHFIKEIKNYPVCLHMVVQNDNWHQMLDMLDLCDRFNFDKVYFNKIEDWNTNLDHSKQDFYKKDEFKSLLAEVDKHVKSRTTTFSSI